MKLKYANEFVEILWIGDRITSFYQFIYDEKESIPTEIIQYFIMHGFGLCIKVDSNIAHIFYVWSFIHNIAVAITIKENKYVFSLNSHTNTCA